MVIPLPRGHTAVMAQRTEPPDSLDFFCTPPWATRAFCEHVLGMSPGCGLARFPGRALSLAARTVWDPAAGEDHMALPLGEYFHAVHRSDVHDYGCGYDIGSFVGEGLDRVECPFRGSNGFGGPDWIAFNPPFNLGIEFVRRALEEATCGVAVLQRSVWMEGEERYALFQEHPPALVAVYSERVPMHRGKWVVNGSTATSYAWFVWFVADEDPRPTELMLIPPGCRKALTRRDDQLRVPAWYEKRVGPGHREYTRLDTQKAEEISFHADQS